MTQAEHSDAQPATGEGQAGQAGLVVKGVSKRFGATQALHLSLIHI